MLLAKTEAYPGLLEATKLFSKKITMGKPIIMGRRTYEQPKTYKSKPRLLPGRLNIIVTSNHDYKVPEGGVVVHSFEEALALKRVQSAPEVCVIGGSSLFEKALPLAQKIYITRIRAKIKGGDTFFHFNTIGWQMVSSELYKKNEVPDRPYDFEFQVWRRQ